MPRYRRQPNVIYRASRSITGSLSNECRSVPAYRWSTASISVTDMMFSELSQVVCTHPDLCTSRRPFISKVTRRGACGFRRVFTSLVRHKMMLTRVLHEHLKVEFILSLPVVFQPRRLKLEGETIQYLRYDLKHKIRRRQSPGQREQVFVLPWNSSHHKVVTSWDQRCHHTVWLW